MSARAVLLSDKLEKWLSGESAKTISSLNKVFAEKAMAIVYFVLMFPAALPLPTGGVSNVMEVIAMLVAVQFIAQRRSLWLPRKWRAKKISWVKRPKIVKRLLRVVWFAERHSRPRLAGFLHSNVGLSIVGCLMLLYCLGSAFAPMFSGIDTIPSIGAVLVAMALIFDDALLMLGGFIVGTVGVGVVVAANWAIVRLLLNL